MIHLTVAAGTVPPKSDMVSLCMVRKRMFLTDYYGSPVTDSTGPKKEAPRKRRSEGRLLENQT